MYGFLFEGAPRFLVSIGLLVGMIVFCLLILLLTVRHHFKINRYAKRMTERETIYSHLVQSVRFGQATPTDIQAAIPPQDYQYFERFLHNTISSVKDIDVSAERKIAEVCGFMDHIKKRIGKTKGWNRLIAIRVLSYFRDKRNLPLFRTIQTEDSVPQAVFAASLGVALCKDPSSFRTIGSRLWEITGHNKEALMVIFSVQGEAMAPVLDQILREEQLKDSAKILITKFLGEMNYRTSTAKISEMLIKEESSQVLASCLYALRYIGDRSVFDTILPFLEHPEFDLRIEALHALAEADGRKSLEFLERRLDDANWWVRREAALAISELGREGIACLRRAAEGDTLNARAAAQTILAELRFHRIATEVF